MLIINDDNDVMWMPKIYHVVSCLTSCKRQTGYISTINKTLSYDAPEVWEPEKFMGQIKQQMIGWRKEER